MIITLEPCTIPSCGQLVQLPEHTEPINVDTHGWDGLTDDGDPVCRDHWCAACHGAHGTPEEFDACEFPPLAFGDPEFRCDPDMAHAATADR